MHAFLSLPIIAILHIFQKSAAAANFSTLNFLA
jgi:hypothetical protein